MRKIEVSGKSIWIGKHKKLGMLIFDSTNQTDLASDDVRLYLLEEGRFSVFRKDIAREKFSSFNHQEFDRALQLIKNYPTNIRAKNACIRCGIERPPLPESIWEDDGLCFACAGAEYSEEQKRKADERERTNIDKEREIQEESFNERYGSPWQF